MKKVLLFSILLLIGLLVSQFLVLLGPYYSSTAALIRVLGMICLSYIMIHVGFEFELDKGNLKQYGWDYIVAMTAATFPWIFVALYYVYFIPHESMSTSQLWKESLLAARFAAPTSAGVLFSMLAAAGLAASWIFKKARILAIFDDLDTILLIIPLKIALIGFQVELFLTVGLLILMLILAWRHLHEIKLPTSWPWVLGYSVAIVTCVELFAYVSGNYLFDNEIHLEVLLPAFCLGCVIAYPSQEVRKLDERQRSLYIHSEEGVSTLVSGAFMVLVGLSIPPLLLDGYETAGQATSSAIIDEMGWSMLIWHILVVTVLSNLGKMFPALCYRKEASLRERLALAVGMFPRGEVGAGILVISLYLGIEGQIVVISTLSLALNLVMTGVFIFCIRWLLNGSGKEWALKPQGQMHRP
ncbi:MAG: sodium:proton antiporter [Chlamydiia bacterium]|nr:sodium:proton antiporter [Chlamydiia bacterium]